MTFKTEDVIPGAKFAKRHSSTSDVGIVEVLRITPTSLVTTTGQRFNLSDGTQMGETAHETEFLSSLDSPTVIAQLRKQNLRHLGDQLAQAGRAFRMNPNRSTFIGVQVIMSAADEALKS